MDVNYILLLAIAIIMGIAYGIVGFFSDKLNTDGAFNWQKFAATIVYSIIIGLVSVWTGLFSFDTITNWQAIMSPLWITYSGLYMGLIYLFSKILVPIAAQFSSKTIFYPRLTGVDPNRKMDEETRLKFFTDQPDAIRISILKAVDEAEAAKTWRYAIEAGAWIYLVEFGEVFGAKHYYFKFWTGTTFVQWKACTTECFEQIRKSCKFPDYNNLY